jgi:hypothetical protein
MNIKRWLGVWAVVLTLICASAWSASAQSNWYIQGRGTVGNVACTLWGGHMTYTSYFTHETKTYSCFYMTLQDAKTGNEIGYVNSPAIADFSQSEVKGNRWSKWVTGEVSFAATLHLSAAYGGGDVPIMVTYANDGSSLPQIKLLSLGDFDLNEAGVPGPITMSGFQMNGYVALGIW